MLIRQSSLSRLAPVVCLIIVIFCHYRHSFNFKFFEPSESSETCSRVSAANATLGFGALLVVSGPDSPRRSNLLQAANVTRIELTIPEQPRWTDDDKAAFIQPEEPPRGTGSVLAWLGHLHVLRSFLDSGLETALIFEDDVDWDIHLRSIQAPVVAASARAFLDPSPSSAYYYGHPAHWDLLYMGHCGDYFGPADDTIGVDHPVPADLTSRPYTLLYDASLPDRGSLHPFTARFLTALGVPEKTRIIHSSQYPLCTFAYAITRASASRLVNEIGLPNDPTGSYAGAFDVKILHACRDKGLRCFSVNPELFHHMEGESMIKHVEQSDTGKPPVDASGYEQVMQRRESSNIGCGFFSKDFYYGDDLTKMEYLREEVGRRGRCLKEGRSQGSVVENTCDQPPGSQLP